MLRKSILILQGQLAEYRRPLFNALAETYDVTVLHAGATTRGTGDRFIEQSVPARRIGPFLHQNLRKVSRAIHTHDVVVAMFDLHWPAYCLPVLAQD